jgi:hypothetical protein
MPPSRLVSPPVRLRLLRRHPAHIPATGTASAATAMVAGTTAAVAAERIADPLGWLFRSGDEAAFPTTALPYVMRPVAVCTWRLVPVRSRSVVPLVKRCHTLTGWGPWGVLTKCVPALGPNQGSPCTAQLSAQQSCLRHEANSKTRQHWWMFYRQERSKGRSRIQQTDPLRRSVEAKNRLARRIS